MIFRWPLVRANQRIVPLDFARLTAAAEDVIAHIAQHALADKTDAATATTGLILWGLQVTAVNGATATVSAGAALVPDNGGDLRWRLVYVEAPFSANIAPPGVGERTDLLRARLDPELEDAGTVEEREYRRVNDDGAEEIYTFSEPRYRRPTGLVSVLDNVGAGANPAAGAGYVRLATVRVTAAGVATVTDLRKFMWPAVSGWDAGAKEGGKYYRGVRSMLIKTQTALSGVVTSSGKLKTVLQMQDGGPNIESNNAFGAWLEMGARFIRSTMDVYARRFVVNASRLDQEATWNAEPNGFGIFAGNIIRAAVTVTVVSNAMDRPNNPEYASAAWRGFNVLSVIRDDIGEYTVNLTAAIVNGTDDYDGMEAGNMIVLALPHVDNPGLPDTETDRDPEHPNFGFAEDPRIINARIINGTGAVKVRTYQFMDLDNSETETAFRVPYVRDRSFSLVVIGPLTKSGADWSPVG